ASSQPICVVDTPRSVTSCGMTGIIMLNPKYIKNWIIMMSEIIFFMSRTSYTLFLVSDGGLGFRDLLLDSGKTLFHFRCIVTSGFKLFQIHLDTDVFILQFEKFII